MVSRLKELERENEELRIHLGEAENALAAIRNGEVDALLVSGPAGDQVYTLQNADLGYRLLVESMQQGAATIVENGCIFFANNYIAQLLKTPLEQMVGSSIAAFVHPDDGPALESLVREAWESSSEGELRLRASDGTEIPALLTLNQMRIQEKRVVCILFTDLTLINATQKLVEAKERLQRVLSSIAEGYYVLDDKWRIVDMNDIAARHFSRPPAELIGTNIWEFTGATAESEIFRIFHDAVAGKKSISFDTKSYIIPDYWAEVHVCPRDGFLDVYFHDITERKKAELDRKRAEKALRELNRTLEQRVEKRTRELDHTVKQLRKLNQLLSEAEEQERRRLAEVLHDDLQQLLVATKIHLGLIAGKADMDPAFAEMVSSTAVILNDAINKTRNLSHELSPPFFDRQDMVASLEWLSGQMRSNYNLAVRLEADQGIETPDAVAQFLFRAAQELLFNITKHAGVNEAEMELRRHASMIRLTVSDRGRGFDPSQLANKKVRGFGLYNIQERIALMGGRFEIESAPDQGSRFTIDAPIE